MAMRRVWALIGTVFDDGTFVTQITDDGDTKYPTVFHTMEEATAEAESCNEDMQVAVIHGDLASFDAMTVHPAWLMDETGIISMNFNGLEIPDLQQFCEQQGLI